MQRLRCPGCWRACPLLRRRGTQLWWCGALITARSTPSRRCVRVHACRRKWLGHHTVVPEGCARCPRLPQPRPSASSFFLPRVPQAERLARHVDTVLWTEVRAPGPCAHADSQACAVLRCTSRGRTACLCSASSPSAGPWLVPLAPMVQRDGSAQQRLRALRRRPCPPPPPAPRVQVWRGLRSPLLPTAGRGVSAGRQRLGRRAAAGGARAAAAGAGHDGGAAGEVRARCALC